MTKTFPKLKKQSVILSSPWDVGYLRKLAQEIHADLVFDQRADETIELFAWEKHTEQDPFDDRLAAQEQIPLPDDPFCRGVIAIFGEWMGRPLIGDWPTEHIDLLDARSSNLPYRLVFPWQEGAEKSGGFPLTGSTFEVLHTIAAMQRARLGEVESPPELLLLFVGPDNLATELDPTDEDWGNRRLRDLVLDSCRKKRNLMTARLDQVDVHIRQLCNFYRFLNECIGLVTKVVSDDENAEIHMRRFLEPIVGYRASVSDADPFKGLGVFEVGDKDVFFGREKPLAAALENITDLWECDSKSHIHWIRGPSGSGKSSFLRAGLLGRLKASRHKDASLVQTVVTPNLLAARGAAPESTVNHWPLRQLLSCCVSALRGCDRDEPQLDDMLNAFDALTENHVNWAIDCLCAEMKTLRTGSLPLRIVLGFDQFEEAVDRLEDEARHAAWSEMITFALRLADLPNGMLLATMRDDRAELLDRHPELKAKYEATAQAIQPLELPSGEDMAEIIRRPFTFVPDLSLDQNLIELLIERVRDFQSSRTSGVRIGSYLPLISLTLYRLYREVGLPLLEDVRNFGSDDAVDDENEESYSSHELDFAEVADVNGSDAVGARLTVEVAENYKGKNYLDVASAIQSLADEAVEESRSEVGPNWDDTEIHALLRRLVSWAGSPEQPFSLPAADWPTGSSELKLAKAMKARRLIIEEQGGQIRLVHEAVVTHWPAASEWLEYELPLLKNIPTLLGLAQSWSSEGESNDVLELARKLYEENAFRLLALWYDLISKLDRQDDQDGRALLRDFCLAMLAAYGEASKVIESTPNKPTLFMIAVLYGEIETVRRMLKQAPDVINVARKDRRTPLFYPMFTDDISMTRLLLENGAEPNQPDEKKWRPVHVAASKGNIDITKLLVEHGARLDGEAAPEGTSALHLAAAEDHADLIRIMVSELGVDADIKDTLDRPPTFRAAMSDGVSALRALIELGAKADRTQYEGEDRDFGWSALHLAARQGSDNTVRALLAAGLEADLKLANGFTALHLAANNGHTGVARIVCEQLEKEEKVVDSTAYNNWKVGAKNVRVQLAARTKKSAEAAPSFHKTDQLYDMTPLHLAVISGHAGVVRILMTSGSNEQAQTGSGATALHLAAENDRTDLIPLLMRNGPALDVKDSNGRTPLSVAIARKNWSTARALIEAGSPMAVEAKGEESSSCLLHDVAASKSGEALTFLARRFDDVDVVGPLDRTPLHVAAATGFLTGVEVLVAAKASPVRKDIGGLTPIHLAARAGQDRVAHALLDDLDDPDDALESLTETPTHLAAYSGCVGMLSALAKHHRLVMTPDQWGYFPLQRAVQSGSLDAVQFLHAQGADLTVVNSNTDETLLHEAAKIGSVSITDWLTKEQELPVDALDKWGRVPIIVAMRYRHYSVAAALLEAGVSASSQDPATGQTIAKIYESQARRAVALELTDARSEDFERALARAGVEFGFAKPREEPTPINVKEIERKASADVASDSVLLPGATGFYEELARAHVPKLWNEVKGDELAGLIDQLTPIDGKWVLTPETTSIHWRGLSWYDSVALISVRTPDLDARDTRIFYLTDQGNLFRLNGTSPPIHEVNSKAPIQLNESNVTDYLRFFCFFVRGDEGPFYIAETPDDPLLPKFKEETAQTVLSSTVRPLEFESIDQDGKFLCNGAISYSNAMFVANFAVLPTGMIEMLNDDPIAGDLPGKVNAPIA